MEKVLEFMNSYSVTIVIASIMVMAFARSIVKIFKMGAMFKADLATKKELREFEDEVRRDMRGYCGQIQKAVTDSCLAVINDKLKDIEEAKKTAIDMRIMKTQLETEMKNAMEKIDEVKQVSNTVRSLSAQVSRLEYNKDNQNERRIEK